MIIEGFVFRPTSRQRRLRRWCGRRMRQQTGTRMFSTSAIRTKAHVFHWKPVLDNKSHREIERAGAAHREIIDRPVDSQFTNIVTGKEERMDDI